MSYGETYQSIRDDGVPVRVIDLMPGSHEEAEFLKLRSMHIAKKLCEAALNSGSFQWFRPSSTNEISAGPFESSIDSRSTAPVSYMAKYRKSFSKSDT